MIQVAEDRQGTSSACHWVCRWRRRWTAPTTPARRISTSYQWRGSREGWTGCRQLAWVTWLWPPSRRESLISVKRCSPPSSSVSASRGAERTVFTCTSKVFHFFFYFLIIDLCLCYFFFLFSNCYCLRFGR